MEIDYYNILQNGGLIAYLIYDRTVILKHIFKKLDKIDTKIK